MKDAAVVVPTATDMTMHKERKGGWRMQRVLWQKPQAV